MPGLNVSLGGLIIPLLAFILAIDVHEFSHALIAYAEGDLTAKELGRVSLNPLRHLDPMGTILVFIAGFGWGKPTPVNPVNLRKGRQSMALVSVAGVVANLATAVLAGLVFRSHLLADLLSKGYLTAGPAQALSAFVQAVIGINVLLAVFNLLPIPPLDGFGVLINVLPRALAVPLEKHSHWGPGILMAIIFLPQLIPGLSHINLLGSVLEPPTRIVEGWIIGS